jgi:hypothetical protein
MSDKIGRNEAFCKAYQGRGQDKINFRRKHTTLAGQLEKKRSKMNMRDINTDGIDRAIQHHLSLAGRK